VLHFGHRLRLEDVEGFVIVKLGGCELASSSRGTIGVFVCEEDIWFLSWGASEAMFVTLSGRDAITSGSDTVGGAEGRLSSTTTRAGSFSGRASVSGLG
jgi:hypothetical protein